MTPNIRLLLVPILASACSASPSEPDDGSSAAAGTGGMNANPAAGGASLSSGGAATSSGGSLQSAGAPSGGGGNNGNSGSAGSGGSTQPVEDGPHPDFTPGEWTVIEPATYCQTPGAYGVTVSPSNPSTIYLVSCGIHRTTDGGSTWETVGKVTTGPTAPDGHLESPNHLRIDPENPDHLYVSDGVRGGTQGFWVSDDGGDTFHIPEAFGEKANNSVGGWTTDVYDIATDPADFNHALVSFHSPLEGSGSSGIIETTDGGESWKQHFPISTLTGAGWGIWFLYRPDLGVGDSNTWLLGAQGGGHWRTTNAGTSWTKVTENSMEHGGGMIYYAADGTLYATGVPNIMRSTDNGATWAMIGPNAGYIGIIGDGTNLYAKSHDRTEAIITALESDDTNWAAYSPQPAEFFGGAYEFDMDHTNGIVYGAFLNGGLMALKLPE